MYGLTVQNTRLAEVLVPVAGLLDACWWYLGGAGVDFPTIRPPRLLPPEPRPAPRRGAGRHRLPRPAPAIAFEAEDLARFSAEVDAADADLQRWIEAAHGQRVGKPGFFSRYAAGMTGDWQMYFASDAPDLPTASFAKVVGRCGDWFDPPPTGLPRDICLVTRDVDHAYLDLFFRDEWMAQSVRGFLEKSRIGVRPFREVDSPEPRNPA